MILENISEKFTKKNRGASLIKGFLISFSILIFFGYFSYTNGFWRFNYPSRMVYPVQGLDVSHHQGEIQWDKVPRKQFSFIYIKATEGGDHTDTKFLMNIDGAKRSGFKIGFYHFFTLCKSGAEQASNFVQVTDDIAYDLPPAVDLEYVGNCKGRPKKAQFVRELKNFIEEIEPHFLKNPIFYTTYEFYDDYLKGTEFEDVSFWVRDVFNEPDSGTFQKWYIWQYADNARVRGIDGAVDLNVMTP